MLQLTNTVKTILCKNSVVAGAADITDATVVDTQGFEGVRFIFVFGAITSGAATTTGVAAKATNAPTPGTDDLAGSGVTVVDTADNKVVITDIFRPQLRYLRPFVTRATQNSVVDAIIAELYGPMKGPVPADTTVASQELHVSPAVGTA